MTDQGNGPFGKGPIDVSEGRMEEVHKRVYSLKVTLEGTEGINLHEVEQETRDSGRRRSKRTT